MTARESFPETSVSLPTRKRSFTLFVVLLFVATPAVSVGGLGHVAATESGLSSPAATETRFNETATTTADAENATTRESTTTTENATTTKSTTTAENTTTETTQPRTNSTSPEHNRTWINGTLATNAGSPVTNDTVQVWHDGSVVAETTTGATGTFAVRVAENRTYTLVYRQVTARPAQTAETQATETQTTTTTADAENTTETTEDDSTGRSVATDDGVPDIAVVTRVTATGERTELSERLPESRPVRVQAHPSDDALLANASLAMQVLSEETNRTTTESTNATVNRTQMATVRGRPDANGTAVFEDYGRRIEIRPSAPVAITGRTSGDQFENTTRRATIANESTISNESTVAFHFREVDREPPVVRAEVLRDTVNVSRPVTLTARNSTDDTSIRTIRWHFEDGTTLTGDTVRRSYASTGTKTVTVEVTDRDGKQNATELEIPVEDRIRPRPALTLDSSTVTAGTPLTFNASTATDNDEIATYRWDVTGDGTYEHNSTNATYTHTYRQTGSKTVRLTVVDASQNAATITRNLTVQPDPPTASIHVNRSQIAIGEDVRFRAADTNDSNATYEWTFGDGYSTTGQSTVRSFPDSGPYTATLTVSGANDTSATTTRTVRVKNHPPVAVVQAPAAIDERAPVTLDARNSSDLDQDELQYAWTQTNGPNVTLSESTTARPSFTAPNVSDPATVTFRGTVMDEHGLTDSANATVEIRPVVEPPRIVAGYSPRQPRANETVTFEAYDGTDSPADELDEYAWDFDGDGTVDARNRTASHRFDANGSHVVTLTAVDGRNRTVEATRTVSVFDSPRAALSAPRNVTAGETVTLSPDVPDAVATPATYEWAVDVPNASALLPAWNATDLLAQNATADPRVTLKAPNVTHPVPVTVSVEMTDARGTTVTSNASFTIRPADEAASPTPGTTTPSTTDPSAGDAEDEPSDGDDSGGGSAGGSSAGGSSAGGNSVGDGSSGGSSGGGASGGSSVGGGSAGGGSDTGGRSSGSATPPEKPDAANSAPNAAQSAANRTPTVDVREEADGRATAAVENASPNGSVRIALPAQAEDRSGSAFESIDLVTKRASSADDSDTLAFELRTRQRATPPDDVPAPPAAATFGYLDVHKDGITNAQIDNASFTFRVAATTLEQRDQHPDAVTLYRYHAGNWSELDTTIVEEGPNNVTYRATTPGFSTFAIGTLADEEGSTAADRPSGESTANATTASQQTTTPESAGESDADDRPELPGGSQGDLNTLYLVALLVAVIGAVLWGYLL